MKTLELKDLKYYLGTGLRMLRIDKGNFSCDPNKEEIAEMTLNNINDIFQKRYHMLSCKPVFLPLSALTEPLPDGSIPIVELAKMAWDKSHLPNEFLYQSLKDNTVFIAFPDKKNCFGYDVNTSSFFGVKEGKCISVVGQLQLFEYLYANHFWLGDQSLFETGEIIDKRTLK